MNYRKNSENGKTDFQSILRNMDAKKSKRTRNPTMAY